jgi:4-hydroxy-tetrahydrodipicolinate synthase
MACAAKEEGAAGILVAPPSLFAWGANLRPEMAYGHFARIADAADLPMVIFEYPPSQGWGYTPEVLLKLIEIDRVIGIKEWSLDILTFERNLRAVRSSGRPVAVMSSFTNSLFASYTLGADGSISGMGSVAVDLQVQLFDAVQRGDFAHARALHERHVVLTDVFYAPPFVDAHNRMKEALAMLGRIDRAIVRPPLQPIPAAERERIREALVEAGLPTAERVLAPA